MAVAYDADAPNPDALYFARRTMQVAKAFAMGKTTKEIALELKLSPKTIEYFRSNIYAKLKIDNLVTLTHWMLANGLITPMCENTEIEVAPPPMFPEKPRGKWRDRVPIKNRKYEGLMEEHAAGYVSPYF